MVHFCPAFFQKSNNLARKRGKKDVGYFSDAGFYIEERCVPKAIRYGPIRRGMTFFSTNEITELVVFYGWSLTTIVTSAKKTHLRDPP